MPAPGAVIERVESRASTSRSGGTTAACSTPTCACRGRGTCTGRGSTGGRAAADAGRDRGAGLAGGVLLGAGRGDLRGRRSRRHPGLGQPRPRPVPRGRRPRRVRAPHGAATATGRPPVAEVLLDQRIACGVGNVYKSEVLWACELDPFTPIGALDHEQRGALLERRQPAAGQPRPADAGHGARQPGGLAVYGRTGKPCFRCGTPIEVRQARRAGPQSPTGARAASCSCRCPSPIPTSSTASREPRRPALPLGGGGRLRRTASPGWAAIAEARRPGRRPRQRHRPRPRERRPPMPAPTPASPIPSRRARALPRRPRARPTSTRSLGAGVTGRRDRR